MSVDESARDARLSWLAVGIGASVCASAAMVGADARWLAALGRTVVNAGTIPSEIPYAAAPSDWVNVPVLGELVFHWLESLGGDRGLLFAQAVAVAAALSLILRDMRALGAPDGARALVIAMIPFAAIPAVFVARSQLFSLALFPLALLLLRSEARAPSRRIWLLPPLIALWSNLHGAVLVGLAVTGVYLLLDRMRFEPRTAWAVAVSSVAALFATPALNHTGAYYVGIMRSEPAVSRSGLWEPLSFHNLFDVLFVLVAVTLVIFALRARPKVWELVCIAMLAVSTVQVGRNSIWLLLFVATPAALGLGRTRLRTIRPARRAVLACAWCVPLLFIALSVTRAPLRTVAGEGLRAQAAALAGHRPILADAEDAEQLALDGRRVLIANPIDAFDRADQRRYLDWVEGRPTGDELVHRQAVVLVKTDTPAQRRLALDLSFREVARDSYAVLYQRRRG